MHNWYVECPADPLSRHQVWRPAPAFTLPARGIGRFIDRDGKMRTEELLEVELTGEPRERGRIYGEIARSLIAEVVDVWTTHLSQIHGMAADDYLDEFLDKTNFQRAIDRYAPELMEEIEGLSEGAGVPVKRMLALNLMDEEWWFGDYRLAGRNGVSGNRCSSFGVAGQPGLPTYLAQNMDIAQWTDGRQILLRITDPDGFERLVFSFAGMIALNGMNSAGIGICVNTLTALARSADGLPVAFVVRSVLDQRSFEDAVKFVENVPHASGQNYIIGGPDRVVCLECSANQVTSWQPDGSRNRVWHTNHPLSNRDVIDATRSSLRGTYENSVARYACLGQRLGSAQAPVTSDDIKATLSSHDDIEHPVSKVAVPGNVFKMGFTAGSTIYALGEHPHLEFAAGPPCCTEYRRFGFRNGAMPVLKATHSA